MRPALDELDRSAAQILVALQEHPRERLLFDQLHRTYVRQLELTRRAVESVSGRFSLTLPKDLSARVRGESLSGRLRAPDATINKPKYGPGSSFDTRYGTGNGDINMETLSGNAELVLK